MEKGLIKKFNKVIIETTGLADPVPIIHTLMTSIDLVRVYKFDGIITVVDVTNADKTFNNHLESLKQVAFANKVILSKVDLGDAKKIENIIKRISNINAKAAVIKSKKGLLPIKEFYGLNDYQPNTESWDVRQWLSEEKNKVKHSNDHKHHHDINRHDDNIKSFSLVTNKPVSMTSLNFFFRIIIQSNG